VRCSHTVAAAATWLFPPASRTMTPSVFTETRAPPAARTPSISSSRRSCPVSTTRKASGGENSPLRRLPNCPYRLLITYLSAVLATPSRARFAAMRRAMSVPTRWEKSGNCGGVMRSPAISDG